MKVADSIAMQAREAGNKVSSVALFKELQHQQKSTSKCNKLPLPSPDTSQGDTKDVCASQNQQQNSQFPVLGRMVIPHPIHVLSRQMAP